MGMGKVQVREKGKGLGERGRKRVLECGNTGGLSSR